MFVGERKKKIGNWGGEKNILETKRARELGRDIEWANK